MGIFSQPIQEWWCAVYIGAGGPVGWSFCSVHIWQRMSSKSSHIQIHILHRISDPSGCYLNLWALYLVMYSPGTSQQLNGIPNLVPRLKYEIVHVQDDRGDRTSDLAFHRISPDTKVVRIIHCNHTANALLLHDQASKVSFAYDQECICMYIPIWK